MNNFKGKDSYDIQDIIKLLPHRYPFVLIDKITEVVPGEYVNAIKNVTINEPFFQGHFPGQPVMPGVMIIESMAQTAAILVVHTLGPKAEGKLVYFMSINNARFRKPVVPGDTMCVNVKKMRSRGRGLVWKMHGDVLVNDVLVA